MTPFIYIVTQDNRTLYRSTPPRAAKAALEAKYPSPGYAATQNYRNEHGRIVKALETVGRYKNGRVEITMEVLV